jgi:class 3 adenylate cyclase/tetratricopeptide (TPR) repeat protein
VQCPECGQRVPQGSKFCSECGSKLATPAAPERSPRDYTPRHLAERILTSRAALEGERKQVTVLFADVRGSTELSERLDPEQWHRILDRFFQILSEGVHRFEGTVNQYTGDGIMALFGAPIAHEDHAQRACYAALWLRDRLREYTQELRRERGLDFAARMGLNSGEVVVGRIGDDLRMDYTAQGHAVNLAQRMEQLAEAGTVYLTQATADRVRGYFELDDLGEFRVKGSSEPLRVLALRGLGALRTRFDLSRARGLSRFVGREAEMQRLEAALSATESGEGRTLAIVADAGAGKSRLCWEFSERCRARGVRVYEGHCLPHGQSTPMAPVLELVRNVFGVEDRDDPETMRRKIAGTLLLADTELAGELPIVFEFLGVPDPERPVPPLDVDAKRRRLRAALGRLTATRSRREAAVFLIEDLHWIDPASEEVLLELLETAAQTRSLLLVNARPEYRAAWLEQGRPDVEKIGLEPLGPAELDELLFAVLGRHESVAPLVPLLRERSGGNPFFLEELVRSLADSGALAGTQGAYTLAEGVEGIDVPSSVHAVLAARIDRLDEADKALLQTAAVIGRGFGEPLLARVAARQEAGLHDALARLEAGEFVRATALYPEPAYAFRHALTQEVALASLLGDARRAIHRRVAEAMIEEAPERHEEAAAAIARHLDEAGEAEAALPWYQRAAAWAGASYPRLTIQWWQRVREIATQLGRSELAVEAFQAQIFDHARLGLSEQELGELIDELEGTGGGDAETLFQIVDGLQAPMFLQGRFREARELAERALAIAESSGTAAQQSQARYGLGMLMGLMGQTREALATMDEAGFHGSEATGLLARQPFLAEANRGLELDRAGRLEEAGQALDRAHAMTVRMKQPVYEALVESWRALHAGFTGDLGAQQRHARRCAELEREVGSPAGTAMALNALAGAELEGGNPAGARELAEQALALIRAANTFRAVEPYVLYALAQANAELGHGERAVAQAREGLALEAQREQELASGPLALARVLLLVGGEDAPSEVRSLLAQAREWIEQHGQRGSLPELCELDAGLSQLLGDTAGAQRHLRAARDAAREIGAGPRAARLDAELAQLVPASA